MTATAHEDDVDAAEDLADRHARADSNSGTIGESVQPQGEAVSTFMA